MKGGRGLPAIVAVLSAVAAAFGPGAALGDAPRLLAPASTAYWQHCGDSIKAHNLSCGKARGIAAAYSRALERFKASPSPKGFACHDQQVDPGVRHVACRRVRGARVEQIRFFYRWGRQG